MVVLDVTIASPEEAVVAIAGGDDSSSTSGITLNIPRYLNEFDVATNTKTKIQQMMPKIDELMYKFQTIFKEFASAKDAAQKSTAQEPQRETRPPREEFPRRFDPYNPGLLRDPMGPFAGIGRGDLDPLSGGGGMLVPNRPNRPR